MQRREGQSIRGRLSLRSRLVRMMVVTLSIITLALLGAVAILNARTSAGTLALVEASTRQSIQHRGEGLVANQAQVLRALVTDNAFGDVRRVVETTLRDDGNIAYGLFLSASSRAWAYVSPTSPIGSERLQAWRELGGEQELLGQRRVQNVRRRMFGQDVFQFSAPVLGEEGEFLGVIVYGARAAPLEAALAGVRAASRRSLLLSVGLLGSLTLGFILVGWLLVGRVAAKITQPLAELTRATGALARGDRDFRVAIRSGDELQELGESFNQMVSELDTSYERLEGLNRTLEQRVHERTLELSSRNRDLRLVLDTVNEGLLTVSPDGELAQERSAMIDRWFGSYERPMKFSDFITPINGDFAQLFELGLSAIVEDVMPIEVNLAQLPTRLRHAGREFHTSYLPVFGEAQQFCGLLVTFRDVTDELLHAQQELEQGELLALFRGFMRDRTVFVAMFDETTAMVEQIVSGRLELSHRKRLLHTLKGNAALSSLNVIAQLCHEIEGQLEEQETADLSLLALRNRWRVLEEALSGFLGEVGKDVVEVGVQDIEEVARELHRSLPSGDLAARLISWRHTSMERVFARLADSARLLARRLDRGDLMVELDCKGVRVDLRRWAPVCSELVHLVRNAVDHGLESHHRRRALGKSARPRLRLAAEVRGDSFVIEVEDDGQGIDWGAVRTSARKAGYPAATEADLLAAMFRGGVSSRTEINSTSGRGIGMAALYRGVKELGGTIAVMTQEQQGTRWTIAFPASLLAPADLSQKELSSIPASA